VGAVFSCGGVCGRHFGGSGGQFSLGSVKVCVLVGFVWFVMRPGGSGVVAGGVRGVARLWGSAVGGGGGEGGGGGYWSGGLGGRGFFFFILFVLTVM